MVCWLRHSRQALSLKMICFSFLTCCVCGNKSCFVYVHATFQVKRPQAKEYFAKAISDMYSELSRTDTSQKTLWKLRVSPHHQPQHKKREVNKDTLLIRIVCNIAEASNGNDFATYCCIVLIIKSCARTGIWFVALFM